MSPLTNKLTSMFDLLTEREQQLIVELIERLLPDDIATPDDLDAISTAREEYRNGEMVDLDEMVWD